MKISVNTIRKINQLYETTGDIAAHGVSDLVEKIGAQLGAVEEVVSFGKKYKGVIIARVVSCDNHPDADRLHICKVDDGGVVPDVPRDEQGYVTVVCGAPNVRQGLLVAWLPPGATVPESVDKDPFVLESRPLRGVVSNGMLASLRELAISDAHEGIAEIDVDAAPGTSFAEAYNLVDDVVIDIENKMFTHRPDCFGFLGVARELAGIQHMPFASPAWYQMAPPLPEVEGEALRLEVQNELSELVPRFCAIAMSGVRVGPSPLHIQLTLIKSGIRPINNIVDYTNFFMLETGQPLHAYDYDKVMEQDVGASHATIKVRAPQQGEKLTLLNGKEIEPRPEAVLIATRDKAIGLGGVMGGADTEVDARTTRIILECANFDMYSVRRTAMAHGLFTDAVTRFNKGQSPLQNRAVIAKIVDEIRRFAEGKVASPLIDEVHLPDEVLAQGSMHPPVHVSVEFINARLGLHLSAEEIAHLLRNVEFTVDADRKDLRITSPFWRTDIALPEDVVEEVGRLYGYDHLPLVLPRRGIAPSVFNNSLRLQSRLRNALSAAGANEVLTYSFVHGNMLAKVGQNPEQAYRIRNALSPDLQYYRMSLAPSLLEKIHLNIKAGHDQFALFEMGKTHSLAYAEDSEGLPFELEVLALVTTADDKLRQGKRGAAFYQARVFLQHLQESLGVTLKYKSIPSDEHSDEPLLQPYDLSRSAFICAENGERLGIVGEYKTGVRRALKLPAYTAGFEVMYGALLQQQTADTARYRQLPRFPKTEQDICFRVAADLPYSKLYDAMWVEINSLIPDNSWPTLSPVDIYQRQEDPAHKQITLRLSLVSYDRTLADNEVSALLDTVADRVSRKFQAARV